MTSMFENAHFINMAFDPAVPYEELPLLPPSGDVEDKTVLKGCIQARVALAELNQICHYFPIPALLLRVYPWLESQGSCALDGTVVEVVELFKLPRNQVSTEKNIERVVALQQALELGHNLVQERRLNISILQELCSAIEGSPMPVRRISTQIFDAENGETPIYTPPVGSELLQSLLGNWEQFIHVDAGNLDPLVLTAIAHYQLEAIQPFSTSNGTLTRLVDYLLLQEEGLLKLPVLNLSSWFYRNKHDYTGFHLQVTQQQKWRQWINFVLKGLAASAEETAQRLKATENLIRHTDQYIAQKLPRIHSADLIDVLFSEPCVRIQNLVERGIARRQTASVYLKKLCAIGVLFETPHGKEKLFVQRDILCRNQRTFNPENWVLSRTKIVRFTSVVKIHQSPYAQGIRFVALLL